LRTVGVTAAVGIAGCSGNGSDANDDSQGSGGGPGDANVEQVARNRAEMYGHFRSLFSVQETIDELKSNTMAPLNQLLEQLGFIDRLDDDPPAVATAVDVAPLPDPIEALGEASEQLENMRLQGATRVLDCGAYTGTLDTCGEDVPDATAREARRRNERLRVAAEEVATAAATYREEQTDAAFQTLQSRLQTEFELTAPLPALAAWADIQNGPYGQFSFSSEGVDYVTTITRANASSIVGARAYLKAQLERERPDDADSDTTPEPGGPCRAPRPDAAPRDLLPTPGGGFQQGRVSDDSLQDEGETGILGAYSDSTARYSVIIFRFADEAGATEYTDYLVRAARRQNRSTYVAFPLGNFVFIAMAEGGDSYSEAAANVRQLLDRSPVLSAQCVSQRNVLTGDLRPDPPS
jgi:hypothetical protein